MDLNDLQLTPSLLAGLYKTHLMEPVPEKAAAESAPAGIAAANKSIQFLGKNQQAICILVNYKKDVYLPDDQLNFITSILQACRLNLGDVAIVNQFREKASFEDLRAQLGCRNLLLFGEDLVVAGLAAPPLFTLTRSGDCTMVLSPAAEQLNNSSPESKVLKSKLWLSLKQMFNV